MKPHYANIGQLFTKRGSTNRYAIVGIVRSSATEFNYQIYFKFYDTSIFSTPPSLDDLYEYVEFSPFLSDSNYQLTFKSFPYLKRQMN